MRVVRRGPVVVGLLVLFATACAVGCSSNSDDSPAAPTDPAARLASDTGVGWDVDVDPATGAPSEVAAHDKPPPTAVNGVTPEEAAYRFFESYAGLFKMKDPRRELRAFETAVDEDGASHVLFEQVSAGVLVEGGGYNVHFTPDGSLGFLGGRYVPNLDGATHAPKLDANAAAAAAQAAMQKIDAAASASTLTAPAAPVLLFLSNDNAVGALVWRVDLSGVASAPYAKRFYVDAATGAIRLVDERQQPVAATGQGVHAMRSFEVVQLAANSYEMRWPDQKGRVPLETHRAGENQAIRSAKLDEWDPRPAGGGGVGLACDAHAGMMDVLNWYKTEVGWSSFDNKTSPVRINVHENSAGEANAYWDGTAINLGDGTIHHGGLDNPRGYLDVLGHEFTHGVTEYTSNLRYGCEAESGALNESFSDTFATFMQSKLQPGANLMAYGEDSRTDGSPLRDFVHPSKGRSAGADCLTKRQGECHADSGISSNAFVLMTFGGNKNDSSGIEVKSGIGIPAAQRLYWYTQRYARWHKPDTKFVDVARSQLDGIRFYSWFPSFLNKLVGGVGDIAKEPVACAWVAVGVIEQKEVKDKYGVRCYCEAKNAPASVCDGKSVMKDEDKQCCKPGDDPLCCKSCVDGGASDGGASMDGGNGPKDGGPPSKITLVDSCKGRADGTYCSELWSFSAIVCKNESITSGLQCANAAKCLGPNGPGTLQCEGGGGGGGGMMMDAGGPTGDTCAGRADGLYCSIASPYSAYQCKSGSTAGGQVCPSGKKCVGPNGAGTTIQCN